MIKSFVNHSLKTCASIGRSSAPTGRVEVPLRQWPGLSQTVSFCCGVSSHWTNMPAVAKSYEPIRASNPTGIQSKPGRNQGGTRAEPEKIAVGKIVQKRATALNKAASQTPKSSAG